jgi:predicted transcriptional regulator
MKNITFSADEDLIEKARAVARSRRKTLNIIFREWLEQFAAESGNSSEYRALMRRLEHVEAGRTFTRDELNER